MNPQYSDIKKYENFKASVSKVMDSTKKELERTFWFSLITALLLIMPFTSIAFLIADLDSRAEMMIGLASFCFFALSTVKINRKVAYKIMERNDLQLKEVMSGFSNAELALFFNQEPKESAMNYFIRNADSKIVK